MSLWFEREQNTISINDIVSHNPSGWLRKPSQLTKPFVFWFGFIPQMYPEINCFHYVVRRNSLKLIRAQESLGFTAKIATAREYAYKCVCGSKTKARTTETPTVRVSRTQLHQRSSISAERNGMRGCQRTISKNHPPGMPL